MTDQDYMALALDLAQKGAGWTSPNPMVGAVLVKQGRIIGQGYHARWGDLHAERAALAACQEDPAGSTLYVTLEPCCHQGKQPPAPRPFWRPASPGWWWAPGTPTPWWPARAWPSFGPRGSR
ncbi:MAG: bifunctional diaminohydroxyphosphoribosylaminopyrimidine deaminase/5-amino-6-(5-phosphoribosylamino)uracil reductase RibD [Evtepia gabavorous]